MKQIWSSWNQPMAIMITVLWRKLSLEGKEIVQKAIEQKGIILVPSFAIGRSQQLLYYMARAVHRGNLPEIPVYLDSPMAIEASRIYLNHNELYDDEMVGMFSSGAIKGDFSKMNLSVTAEDSKALNSKRPLYDNSRSRNVQCRKDTSSPPE